MRRAIVRLLVVLSVVAVAAGAGCSGGDEAAQREAEEATTEQTAPEPTTTEEAATTTEPAVDPAVRMWVRRWERRFATPMRRAGQTIVRSAVPAVQGDARADYALLGALNRIGRCQSDLFELEPVPPDVARVQSLSNRACRQMFVANEGIVDALNAGDVGAAQGVVRGVRRALGHLKRAQQAARAATSP